MRSLGMPSLVALAIFAAAALTPAAADAAICAVPSSGYPTIASAIADMSCTEIDLGAATYVENVFLSRDLTLAGAGSASTTIAGWLEVSGTATDAVLNALRVDPSAASSALCYARGLDVRGGARTSGTDLVVFRPASTAACTLFADGFESGGSTRWSAALP